MRAASGLIALLALSMVGCEGAADAPTAGAAEAPELEADQVMGEVTYDIRDNGARRAVLEADEALVYEDSSMVRLRPVTLTLFNADGQPVADLTSRRGQYDLVSQHMIARDSVVLITRVEPIRRIETEELHYDPEGDRLWSDVATTLYEDDTVVHGAGFTSDGRMRDLRIREATAENLELQF